MWKDKTGVSPIIAVILMVAITVVLAATIYAWVSGFGAGGGEPEIASCVVKGTSNRLRVTLSQGGDGMPSGGYTDFSIYVNGSEVQNVSDVDSWDVGQSFIIQTNFTEVGAETHPFGTNLTYYNEGLATLCKYAVTVEIMGTVVFDKDIQVTG